MLLPSGYVCEFMRTRELPQKQAVLVNGSSAYPRGLVSEYELAAVEIVTGVIRAKLRMGLGAGPRKR